MVHRPNLIERPGNPGDLAGIMALVAAVKWPHRAADIAAAMTNATTWVAEAKAEDRAGAQRGTVAGVAMSWIFDEATARIGLIIVSPDMQGRGLGRGLTARALQDSGTRAVKLLATADGQPLYEKLGFGIVGSSTQHQGIYQPGDETLPGDTGDAAVRPASKADEPALLALDRRALGGARSAVLAQLFSEGKTHVLIQGESIQGYAVVRDFGRGRVVGPIVAPDEASAIALFEDALAKLATEPGFIRVDLPQPAPAFSKHLAARGIPAVETCSVMCRGNWPQPEATSPYRTFALASHAWG